MGSRPHRTRANRVLDLRIGCRYNAIAEKQKFRQGRNAMSEATIQLRDKGVITLPMTLRRKYSLRTGDVFAVSDLGEGVFMITPKTSRVAALGDKVADILQAEGVTVEEMLEGLDAERERYYRDHYVDN
jgi:bifunctional DNA-binding transcriptional regulator/antitoxin component of YhaV-PrlF toxin-antitoxin module